MDGTNISNGATAPDAAEGWHTAEARRERKAREMERVRMMAVDLAARMSDTMMGRIPEDRSPMFDRIKDPIAAFANLSRAIVQIGMYEDRLDETAEERAARLAAQKAAREQAARAAEAERKYTKSQADHAERRTHFQRAMREIALESMPDVGSHDRQDMLDDLFLDFDYGDNAGDDRDPAEVIIDLCARAGIEFEADAASRDLNPTPAERHAASLRLAQTYLDATAPRGEEPPAQAQGPPH